MWLIVPQLKIKGRFEEWWPEVWHRELLRLGIDHEILLKDHEATDRDRNCFTNVRESILFELTVLKELYSRVREGDVVFFFDLDFPGFSLPMSYLLKLKTHGKVVVGGILHGAYFNCGDIWHNFNRNNFMKALFDIVDKIFVGSKYFYNKLINNLSDNINEREMMKRKLVKHFLPYYPRNPKISNKENYVFIYGKNKPKLSKELQKIGFKVISGILNPSDYINVLKKAKFLVSLRDCETFGYTIIEAMDYGVIPILPNKFSYPELVYSKLLYTSVDEIVDKILSINYKEEISRLKEWFYGKIIPETTSFIKRVVDELEEMRHVILNR